MVVLLPILDDYYNGCACARSLDTASKIKIMREPSVLDQDPPPPIDGVREER
jgi:hypothetical protein